LYEVLRAHNRFILPPDLRTRPPPQLSTMSNTTDSVIEKLPNTAELKEDVKAAS